MKMVSVIIVAYKSEDTLFSCLYSLYTRRYHTPFEVIIVDNDPNSTIKSRLLKKFPLVRYFHSLSNDGFGAGNNKGVKIAKGDFLFFLNPDTIVTDQIIDILSRFLEKHKQTAIVAPLLLDKNKKIYPLQGTRKLTPVNAIFAYSFINKWFPTNPFSKNFWLAHWDTSKDKEVDVAPGSAFMMRKHVFEKLGGFDEQMFLYFEEYDVCLQTKELGYKIYITPDSKLIHLWGESTKYRNDLQKIFNHSRFYYFKKHFGMLQALLVEMFLRIDKEIILLFLLLSLATLLRFHQIKTLIPFFSDQGWFYLSAKNMLVSGQLPLVGITASHVWLHQGAYWTYLLACCLFLFHFNPVSGAYLTAGLDVITVGLIYYLGKILFSIRVGLIAACLYATSPLIIVASRTAYHTSPIPFFTTLLLLACTFWVRGNTKIIPLIIGLLCILYNFEIATISLSFVLCALILYGYWQKKPWRHIFTRQNIMFSLLAYVVTMLPMLLYDISHQFPQTIKIFLWIGYKLVAGLGIYRIHPQSSVDWIGLLSFLSLEMQRLIFMPNGFIATIIFVLSFLFLVSRLVLQVKRKRLDDFSILLLLFTLIPIGILLVNGVLSEAYLPVLLPPIMLVIAFFFDACMSTRNKRYIISSIVFIMLSANIYSLISSEYFTSDSLQAQGFTIFPIKNEEEIILKMEAYSANKPFSITSKGFFPQSTDNYQYLAEWMGVKIKSNATTVYIIQPVAALTSKSKVIYTSDSIAVTYEDTRKH